jgi:hypothetical protein
VLAAELGLNYVTVLQVRRKLHDNAQGLQSEEPIPDFEAESDELFQNAGEKGDEHFDPLDHPGGVRTNGGDAALRRMIDHPVLV